MTVLSRRALIGGIAGLAASVAARADDIAAPNLSKSRSKRVLGKVARFRDRYDVPGLSVAFSRKGRPVHIAAFGDADRAAGEAVTAKHLFRIASISKPMTASAILLLVERGKLSLEQPVFGDDGALGGRFILPPASAEWLKQITIDHLLTHTTGAWTNDTQDPMFRYVEEDHATLIANTLMDAELSKPPGKAYAYSNFGYCLLGRVIEQVSGQSYEEFVREAILRPAGADGMMIAGNVLSDRRPLEVVYHGDYAYDMNVRRMDSHGGWIGSATDLIKFAQTIDGYKSVVDTLSRKSVTLMATPTRVYSGYGRGWSLNPRHRNRWHTGRLPGTTSILVRVDGDACFAGLVNISTEGLDGALDTLMWDIYAEVMA